MSAIRVVIGFLIALSASAGASSAQARATNPCDRLDARFSSPNARQVERARTRGPWNNPTLLVNVDGLELITTGGARQSIAIADVRCVLVRLPLSVWPLGRVAAVQENGLGPVEDADRFSEAIRRNRDALIHILQELRIQV